MSQPMGNPLYGPLIIRLALGGYLILAGFYKLEDIPGFLQVVKSFHLMPDKVATLYGTLVPYIEVATGLLVIIGMWTTVAAILIAAIFGSYIYALGIFPVSREIFNKDIVMLAAALSLMYSGAGAFSVDKFRST